MLLLVLTLIPVLAMGPILTQNIFRELEVRVRDQIELDNAAISGGRRDRALLRWAEKKSSALQSVDLAHHSVHLCALTPGPHQAACASADQQAHATLKAGHAFLHRTLQVRWLAHGLTLQKQSESRGALTEVQRSRQPPLRPKPCRVCGLEVGLEVSSGIHFTQHLTRTRPDRQPLHSILVLLPPQKNREWQYRLALSQGAGP